MNLIYAGALAYVGALGVVSGFCAVASYVDHRRARRARQNRLGQSREVVRPPLPRRVPERVVTPESCGCADCDELVRQVQITVAVALARAEAASIDAEWADVSQEWSA